MGIVIAAGTIDEAIEVEAGIPEFDKGRSRQRYESRLATRKHLILIAKDNNRPVAFKVGFEETPTIVYSWLGGVIPGYRRMGLAQQLLEIQETWAESAGYHQIRVKSMNRFPGMLILLIKNAYQIQRVESADKIENNEIHFIKDLSIAGA